MAELTNESRSRNDLSEEMVLIGLWREEKKRKRLPVELFSLAGTSSDRRERIYFLQQDEDLKEMEKSMHKMVKKNFAHAIWR